jgi:hypothetical protein
MIKIKLINESADKEADKQVLLEGIDVNTIKKVIQTLRKFKLNLDIAKILPHAGKIIQAVKDIVALDNKQNTQNLKEAKKPILIPLLNKYGLVVAGIAMAIVSMSGSPPEIPSQQVIKMISMGLQNKGVSDFLNSMKGAEGAEFATDLFSGLISESNDQHFGPAYHGGTWKPGLPIKMGRGALGTGAYFTPKKEIADKYAKDNGGQTSEVYLDISNPLKLYKRTGHKFDVNGQDIRDPCVAALFMLGMDLQKAENVVEKAYDDHGYVGKQISARAMKVGYDAIFLYSNDELYEICIWDARRIVIK